MIVPAFQEGLARGLTKVIGHQKCVHVLVEPSPNCTGISIPSNTSELIPGGSGVAEVLQNLSGRDITLESNIEVGIVTATNIVPSIQIPDKHDLKEMEEVQCKWAQADVPEKEIEQDTNTEVKDVLKKTDMSGIADWDPKIQQEACDLICEYACIFL